MAADAGKPKDAMRDEGLERGVAGLGTDDPFCRMYVGARFNFWAFVDERDSAQSIEKGLSAAFDGSHVLFVNDTHNSLGYDAQTLARLFFPQIPLLCMGTAPDAAEFLADGVVAYLEKPFTIEALQAAISALVPVVAQA